MISLLMLLLSTFHAPAGGATPETWEVTRADAFPGALELGIGARYQDGVVPPFRAGDRDRAAAFVDGAWRPAPGVVLDARWEVLQDQHPDGTRVRGPGDVELGVLARLPGPLSGAHGGVAAGFRVKLPDAADEEGLGTDETDVTLLLLGQGAWGRIRGSGGAGLAILGSPLHYAAQDDVPFLVARVGWEGGPAPLLPALFLDSGFAFPTSLNPARGETGLGVRWGTTWGLGLRAAAGWTPAAPDFSGELRLSWTP